MRPIHTCLMNDDECDGDNYDNFSDADTDTNDDDDNGNDNFGDDDNDNAHDGYL